MPDLENMQDVLRTSSLTAIHFESVEFSPAQDELILSDIEGSPIRNIKLRGGTTKEINDILDKLNPGQLESIE